MFNRLGGLVPLEWCCLSLSLLASFLEHVLGFPLSLYPLSFLLLAWAVFPGYGNVCFTFPVTYWAISVERWQCLFYFFALCDSIVHDVCMCIYIYAYVCVGDHALCMVDSPGYVSDPL